MKKTFTAMTASLFFLIMNAADQVTITVSNPIKSSRLEMVEADYSAIQDKLGEGNQVIIIDADGKEIPSQITWDGKIIFQAGVSGKGKSVYYAKSGIPQEYEPKVKGRLFVERQDEFGWENDKVAYRVYGHGGAVGYDLFNKSTSDLMLDYWYASEQNQEMRSVSRQLSERGYQDLADQVYNAFSYHIDHGKGMDCYTVGPTLGGGANALLNTDGSLFMPKCYQSFEILDKGPLRFTVRFTYPEQEYNGEKVKETRIISLDAGSHFNRVSVFYEGLTKPVQMASGTVIHKSNPSSYVISPGYMGYEDLGDASVYNAKYRQEFAKQMGKIYVGLLYTDKIIETSYQARENGIAIGHVLATVTYLPETAYTYYFGSAWDRNPETSFQNLTDWEAYLSKKSIEAKNPLKIKIK